MTEIFHQLLDWVAQHPYWSGTVIFLVAMSESVAVIGLIVPGVVIMFGIGALVAAGAIPFWSAMAWAVAGAVAGDGLSFCIGYLYKERLTGIWPFSRHPQSLRQGIQFFEKYGGKSVAFGRFFGPVRAIVPLVAGMMGMRPSRYLVANVLSALAWAPAYLIPGIVFGASLELASEVAFRLVLLLVALVAGIWLLIWLIRLVFKLLHPHASAWVRAILRWSEVHPKMGEIAAALADPAHPEARGLAILATLLVLTTGGFGLIFGIVLNQSGLPGFEKAVADAYQSLRTPWGDHISLVFSRLADLEVIIPLVLMLTMILALQRQWRTAVYWLSAAGFSLLAPVLLKYGLRIPRPTPDIPGLGPWGFPSAHVLRATVLFGFLSVLIARPVSVRFRWFVYGTAGLLIASVCASRLYLGAHWLSDVAGSLTLGLAWVSVLGIAYHRHTRVLTRWKGLSAILALTLVGATAIQTWMAQERDFQRYQPIIHTVSVSLDHWWGGDWAELPQQRKDIRGRQNHPFNVQYAGEPGRLQTHLDKQGWLSGEMLSWGNALKLLSPSLGLQELPVLPQVHDGRHEAFTLVKNMPDGSRLVVRLWPSGVRLAPGDTPLWIGNVSAQRRAGILGLVAFPETDLDFQAPFRVLLADSQGLETRQPPRDPDLLLVLAPAPDRSP